MGKDIRCAALLAAAVLSLSGCLSIDAVLNANGSGTMTLEYDVKPGTSEASQRKLVAGPHVTIESGEVKNGTARFRLKFDDVTKLNTSPIFALAKTITLDKHDGTRTLVARVPLPAPKAEAHDKPEAPASDKSKSTGTPKAAVGQESGTAEKKAAAPAATEQKPSAAWRIALTLPGEVVKTNATDTKGSTAKWTILLEQLRTSREVVFEVTFKVPAGATPQER